MEYLETELEGLQDALYRRAVLEASNVGQLRRRTTRERLGRDLSADARGRRL